MYVLGSGGGFLPCQKSGAVFEVMSFQSPWAAICVCVYVCLYLCMCVSACVGVTADPSAHPSAPPTCTTQLLSTGNPKRGDVCCACRAGVVWVGEPG